MTIFDPVLFGDLAPRLLVTVAVVICVYAVRRFIRPALNAAVKRVPGAPTAEKKVRTARTVRFVAGALDLLLLAASVLIVLLIWVPLTRVLVFSHNGNVLITLAVRLTVLIVITKLALEAVGLFSDIYTPHASLPRKRAYAVVATGARTAITAAASLMALSLLGFDIAPLLIILTGVCAIWVFLFRHTMTDIVAALMPPSPLNPQYRHRYETRPRQKRRK